MYGVRRLLYAGFMRSVAMRLAAILLFASAAARAQDDGPAYLVANINSTVDSRAGSHPAGFTTVGTHLFFVADDGTHGYQLWRTDRLPRGAVRVSDDTVEPQYPRYLTPVGFDLYFLTDGLRRVGPEPGAEPVLIEPGPIEWLRRVGDLVFFNADSGDIGEELWALPFDTLPEIYRDDRVGTPAPTVTPVPSAPGGSDGCQVDAGPRTAGWPLAVTAALVALLRRAASGRVRHHVAAVHCRRGRRRLRPPRSAVP